MAPSRRPRRPMELLNSMQRHLISKSILVRPKPNPPITDIGMPLTFGIEVECYVALDWQTMLRTNTVRRYLREKLGAANLPTTESANPKAAHHSYKKWMVTSDSSLTERFSTSDLVYRFPHMGAAACANRFAVEGVELVSRPMLVPSVFSSKTPFEQPQLLEISNYTGVLRGNDTPRTSHGAFVSESCGMHTHFGQPDGSPLPLNLLRHLGYLLVLHEQTINQLHPYHRTPHPETVASEYCQSNRTTFLIDYHTCYKYRQCLIPLAEIRKRIFDPEWSLDGLAWLMGGRVLLDAKGHERWPGEDCELCSPNQSDSSEPIICMEGCPSNTNSPCAACFVTLSKAHTHGRPCKYKIVNWSPLVKLDGPHSIEFR